jgi:glycosyltransferase involved in cell wall biosynthesis
VTRLLFVISNFEYGGAQRQVVELANHLDPGRFEAHVCSLSSYAPLATSLRHAGSRLHIIPKLAKFDVTVVPRLVALLRRLHIDIVQSYLFDADIAARLAGRLALTRAVVGTERNTDYSLRRRHLIAYRLTHRQVDLIIANSHAGAAFSSRVLGHPPSFYRVVHNGVDLERFTPGPATEVREELGIAADEPVVGMFASFKAQKNHPLAFQAARLLMDRLPRARFLFVGDMLFEGMHGSANHARRMHRVVDDLGIRSRCLFLGNRRDVARLYRACDVTILPSLFEGTPNVLLESMATAVPVVATNVADNAFIVPDGKVGFLIRPGDAVALAEHLYQLLLDHPLRLNLGLAARAWVSESFSTAALARRTAQVYDELLARPSRARSAA